MSDKTSVVVSGVAYWAHIHEPSKTSGAYQVDVTHLSDSDASKLTELGVLVKEDEDKPEYGRYITARSQFSVPVVDSKLKQIPADVLVGNGSLIKVSIKPYEWTFKGKKGISPGLAAMQILELVSFNKLSMFDEEDGYEVSNSSTSVGTVPWTTEDGPLFADD